MQYVAIVMKLHGHIVETTGPYDSIDAACREYKVPVAHWSLAENEGYRINKTGQFHGNFLFVKQLTKK